MRQIETKGMMEQFQAHLNNTNNQRIIFFRLFWKWQNYIFK